MSCHSREMPKIQQNREASPSAANEFSTIGRSDNSIILTKRIGIYHGLLPEYHDSETLPTPAMWTRALTRHTYKYHYLRHFKTSHKIIKDAQCRRPRLFGNLYGGPRWAYGLFGSLPQKTVIAMSQRVSHARYARHTDLAPLSDRFQTCLVTLGYATHDEFLLSFIPRNGKCRNVAKTLPR
jgi:hypothetical protein